MKKMKNKLNDEMGYFKGMPSQRYGNLVGQDAAILFEKMKLETIYDFDFDGISVEDVLGEAN